MSTRVLKSEWYSLVDVPQIMYNTELCGNNLGGCDNCGSPGKSCYFMQTPDHRAIALCFGCRQKVRAVQSQPLPPSTPATFDEVNQ